MGKVKRVLSLLLCMVMVLGCIFHGGISGFALSERHGYISGSNVNIRSGAGTSNTSLGKLAINTPVLVTGVAFDSNGVRWYKLTANTGTGDINGYVHSDYVVITGSDKTYSASVTANVNVRNAPGTWNDIVTKLGSGTMVTVIGTEDDSDGDMWYHVSFADGGGTKTGYIYSSYIELIPEYEEDVDFETYLTQQGFPESYKVKLRQLHALYPNWKFVADHIPMTWAQAVAGETALGRSLVHSTAVEAWKSLEKGAYYWDTKEWRVFDSGGWVEAADSVVKYYLDPRNFLTTTGVFLFVSMKYDAKLNTKENLQGVLNGTFMEGAFPESTYNTYADVLIAAAKESTVSPISLASMIIIEQGSKGTGKSISGTVSGYEGYYNFYNIRAYASGGYTAVQYGLLYAKGGNGSATDFYRPWNTRAKSIIGGAKFYADEYILRGQTTLYYKKFNVAGTPLFGHQFMTNIQGAASEASKTADGYKEIMDAELIFNIPVYKNMPEEISPYPTTKGNNNCYLSALSVGDYKFTPTFDRYTNNYDLVVSGETKSVVITPVASASDATVTGGGKVDLAVGNNKFDITVTSSSGLKNVYTVSIFREEPEVPDIVDPTFSSSVYKIKDTTITGITPSTSKEVFLTNFKVEGGTASLPDSTDFVKTGDTVNILDNSGAVRYTYTLIVSWDVNCDGKFSLVDLSLVKRYLLHVDELSGNVYTAADVNNDGKVSLADLSLMKRRLLRIDIY